MITPVLAIILGDFQDSQTLVSLMETQEEEEILQDLGLLWEPGGWEEVFLFTSLILMLDHTHHP